MSEGANTTKRRSARNSDPRAVEQFLEELSWLLHAHADLDFRSIKNARAEKQTKTPELFERLAPKNPNIVYLVGTLPSLFIDESLFPSNEDIAEFASTALKINLPRWHKKARFELVGHIVCRAVELDNKQVERLVRALVKIVDGGESGKASLKARKQQGMSWNEVIQDLLAQET
ncbi:hypothetical protein [Methylobacterium organophilum]|uniref:hypothetical protein n=1 Tax=Methylobacterium organophilum TaxID=410 RepID=UPI001EE18515|nr:hypothetical protein [Methylobacterium organophilum]